MNQEEAKLQSYFFTEFGIRFPHIVAYAIPNGGFRNLKEAERLKRMGVLKGVWDIFIAYPYSDFCGIYIEMKSQTGVLTPEQKEFRKNLCERYMFSVLSSKEDIREFIIWLKKFAYFLDNFVKCCMLVIIQVSKG